MLSERYWSILLKNYKKDDPIKLAGTTAFFTIFAVAPIFMIIISVLGLVIGKETVNKKMFEELNSLVGSEGAGFIETIVGNFRDADRNVTGTIVGIVVFLVASTTFFTIL